MWISPDNARQFHSLYSYTGNGYNPINGFDPDGNEFDKNSMKLYEHAKANDFYNNPAIESVLEYGKSAEHKIFTSYNDATSGKALGHNRDLSGLNKGNKSITLYPNLIAKQNFNPNKMVNTKPGVEMEMEKTIKVFTHEVGAHDMMSRGDADVEHKQFNIIDKSMGHAPYDNKEK